MGIQKDMGGRAQGTGITLLGGRAGEPGRGLVYRGLVYALETGISLHRGPVDNNGGERGTPFTPNSERYLKEGSRNGASLYIWALCKEKLDGRPLYWEP